MRRINDIVFCLKEYRMNKGDKIKLRLKCFFFVKILPILPVAIDCFLIFIVNYGLLAFKNLSRFTSI